MLAILLWCIVGYLAECGSKGEAEALRFPKEVSLDNYVKLTSPISEALTAVTVCTWMKKFLDPLSPHMWFSYAVEAHDNEIVIADDSWHGVARSYGNSDSILLRNEWYHVCVTWGGTISTEYYINGVLLSSKPSKGSSVHADGILIIGQDQDSFGGKFDISQAFGGELYQLNVFSRRLSLKDVVAMYHGGKCSKPSSFLLQDIVISWNDILDAPRSGAVNVTSVGCNYRSDRIFLDKVTKLVLQERGTLNY